VASLKSSEAKYENLQYFLKLRGVLGTRLLRIRDAVYAFLIYTAWYSLNLFPHR
jgi:hypothetical protein